MDLKTNPDRKNIDAAYRRVHKNEQIAVTYITIVGKTAFLFLGLTFSNTHSQEKYTTISKAAIDLGINILA